MKRSEYEPYGAKCACGVYISQHISVGVDAARLVNQSDFIFAFSRKNQVHRQEVQVYIPHITTSPYSIFYINLIKHVLVQSPVKTTPENSRKGGHGHGSPWRLEDNPSKSESMYISRVSLRIADPEVKSGRRE